MSEPLGPPPASPQWQRPPTSAPDAAFRNIASLFGRGLVYALAFWAIYGFVYLPLYYAWAWFDPSGSTDAQTQRQMHVWDEQQRQAGEMMKASEAQQRRMDAVLTKQEEQGKRMDAILEAWERQSRGNK